MRGITDCFRSIRDLPTPCDDHQHWPTWTTRERCRGIGEERPCPTTMLPAHVRGSVSKSLVGTLVDEIVLIGGWKTEGATSYYVGVDNLYTGPTFIEKNGQRLRDRERVATVPGRCASKIATQSDDSGLGQKCESSIWSDLLRD